MTVQRDGGEPCPVCGGTAVLYDDVLWSELTQAWELSDQEIAYVNVQQGEHCASCSANVRSQALARALVRTVRASGSLEQCVKPGGPLDCRLLEINEAGGLTPFLSRLPQHVLATYPACDMMRLPYRDGSFDLVVHSDTLEHISDPLTALGECRRVLAPGGSCVFTVPIIVGRLTRSRRGLPASYHGHKDCRDLDFLVHTEFGADAWTWVINAGFERCELVWWRYPAGIAMCAGR